MHPPKPAGDPEAMKTAAKRLRMVADELGKAAAYPGNSLASLDVEGEFVSVWATQFLGYRVSVSAAVSQVHHVAAEFDRAAGTVEDALRAWRRECLRLDAEAAGR